MPILESRYREIKHVFDIEDVAYIESANSHESAGHWANEKKLILPEVNRLADSHRDQSIAKARNMVYPAWQFQWFLHARVMWIWYPRNI